MREEPKLSEAKLEARLGPQAPNPDVGSIRLPSSSVLEHVHTFSQQPDWMMIGLKVGIGFGLASSTFALADALAWYSILNHWLKVTFAGYPLN